MRRMLREVPNCELTHADRERDVHFRGWRTYVAEICDYIMVSSRPSRSQRQHGGREISFVSRRAARCCVGRLPRPPFDAARRVRRGRLLAPRPDVVATTRHNSLVLAFSSTPVTGTRVDPHKAHRSLDPRRSLG